MKKRGFQLRNSLAQASVEYLMVIGLVFAIMVPVTYIFLSYSTEAGEQVTMAKADKIADDIVNTAEEVFYLGEPSKTTIKADMPASIFDIIVSPNKRELVLRLGEIPKYKEAIAFSKVNLKSYLIPQDYAPGRHDIKVEAKADHAVIYTGELVDAVPRWCGYYIAYQIMARARPVYGDHKSRAAKLFMPAECDIADIYLPALKEIVTVVDIEGVPTGFITESDVPAQENDRALPPSTGGTIVTTESKFYDFIYTPGSVPIIDPSYVLIDNAACRDADGDLYGNVLDTIQCGDPDNWDEKDRYDCEDDATKYPAECMEPFTCDASHSKCAICVNPGMTEACNDGIDNDCNDKTDSADPYCIAMQCTDLDGDGYNAYDAVKCPAGNDCNDNPSGGAAIHPGAAEICNGVDDDCDTLTLDGSGETAPQNDNWNGVCTGSYKACGGAAGWQNSYTGIPDYEITENTCDNLDNDCNLATDEGCDDDNDDYCDSGKSYISYTPTPAELAANANLCTAGNDCNDIPPVGTSINPSATEICGNAVDENCDGIAEPCAALAFGCSIRQTSCNAGETTIFKISDLTADPYSGHAELYTQTNFINRVCCSLSGGTLSNACGTAILKLSDATDAHVDEIAYGTFTNNVCLSATPGTLTCSYKSFCGVDEACLASISASTDAHVGSCNNLMGTRICCKVT